LQLESLCDGSTCVFIAWRRCRTLKSFRRDRPHFGKEVKAIQERARGASGIATLHGSGAQASSGRVAGKATGTRVTCGNQQDIGRETGAFIAAIDAHFALFEWLTQAFECRALELGEFVEKEHPAVCARKFARTERTSTAKQRLSGNAVVRSTKGCALRKQVHRAMQGLKRSEFERAVLGWRGQELGNAPGEHAFAGAGRALQEQRMAPRNGQNGSGTCMFLPAYLVESLGCARQVLRGPSRYPAAVEGRKGPFARFRCGPCAQTLNQLLQVCWSDRLNLCELGLGEAFWGNQHMSAMGEACHGSKKYPARSRSQAAGKIKFSDREHRMIERWDLMGGKQERASESEVDRKPALWKQSRN
jgi:hypothetical protein